MFESQPCPTGVPRKFLCRCLKVTEATIIELFGTTELQTFEDIRRLTGAGAGCHCCQGALKRLLVSYRNTKTGEAVPTVPAT